MLAPAVSLVLPFKEVIESEVSVRSFFNDLKLITGVGLFQRGVSEVWNSRPNVPSDTGGGRRKFYDFRGGLGGLERAAECT